MAATAATAAATATAADIATAIAGKGTNAVDGAALVTALARHLAGEGQGTRCKALLTLHFLEVFKQGLIGVRSGATGRTDLPGISVFHMEVCVYKLLQYFTLFACLLVYLLYLHMWTHSSTHTELISSCNSSTYYVMPTKYSSATVHVHCMMLYRYTHSIHRAHSTALLHAYMATHSNACMHTAHASQCTHYIVYTRYAHMQVHLPTAADQQDPNGLIGDSPLDDISGDVTTRNPSSGSCDPVPLFKLAPGVTGTSHGLACARKGGLPEPVLQRAAELMQLMSGIDSSSTSSSGGSSDKQADREGSKARAQLAPRALSMLVS
jgi:hypothetical protein